MMICMHVYVCITDNTQMSPWKMILLVILSAVVVAVVSIFLCKSIHVVL